MRCFDCWSIVKVMKEREKRFADEYSLRLWNNGSTFVEMGGSRLQGIPVGNSGRLESEYHRRGPRDSTGNRRGRG